jgi:membrane protease YdiL (CAAX protease family)
MKSTTISQLRDPLVIGAVLLYALALMALAIARVSLWPAVILGLGVLLLSTVVVALTRRRDDSATHISRARTQLQLVLGCYGLILALAAFTLARGIELVNGFTNWFFLVLVPFGLLLISRRSDVSLRNTLRSVGLAGTNTPLALNISLLIIVLLIPLLAFVGEQQRLALRILLYAPLRGGLALIVAFVLALLTAGFVEEFFFRGVLQSRLEAVLGSQPRALLIASLLFGLFHLPAYFFSALEPTRGNLLWAAASVITEPMVTGLLFGILWIRTRNLAAPVLVHAFIDALAMLPALRLAAG